MAKRGEAGRALSAAYMASLIGGLIGAFLLFISIPVLRAFVLSIGAPQLLAFAAFGISMVAILSGSAPLRGLAAACLGLMLSLIGPNPHTGQLRWTFDTIYLRDGVPLVAAVLGLFALPELCDLAIRRASVAASARYGIKSGMLQGALDVLRNWWLTVRCSAIGAALGTIPGITGAVVDWLIYGHAYSTEKGAKQTFGKGDVRGVIAVESCNNSKEAGQLVPAIAFGVPANAAMALIISAFLAHGMVPGPEMLTKNLNVTFTLVWSMAIANVLGAGICYLASGYLAMLAMLRYTLILPGILCIVFIGAFESSRQWGDLYTLFLFGVLGWTMKQLRWARPPLILGLVLGEPIERYLFISVQRYGVEWLFSPVVVILFSISAYLLVAPLVRAIRAGGGLRAQVRRIERPRFRMSDLLYVALIGVFFYMLLEAMTWGPRSRIVPVVVGLLGLSFTSLGLLGQLFLPRITTLAGPSGPAGLEAQSIHMDLTSDTEHLAPRTVLLRGAAFFGWILAFMLSMALIGLIPTVPLFIIAYMRVENREPWALILPQAVCIVGLIYVVFHGMLGIPWPQTLLGTVVPALTIIPSV